MEWHTGCLRAIGRTNAEWGCQVVCKHSIVRVIIA